jgi:thiamine pyrophosphate-dependent acetolactate synthase large subunit-like protein
MIERRHFARTLLADRGGLLVVSGLGGPTYDVATAGDHPLNFYLWGAMGAAAMTGLGLALARPDRRVAVFTGDGEMLMGLGSLATIGVKQPENLAIVVFDNGRYGETGMQESHTHGTVDLVTVAKACGFRDAITLAEESDITAGRKLLYAAKGPVLIDAEISSDDTPRVLPSRDGHANKLRFMAALNAAE